MTDGDGSVIEAPTCLLCTDAAVAARKAQPSVFGLASRARAQGGVDLELVADWLGADAPTSGPVAGTPQPDAGWPAPGGAGSRRRPVDERGARDEGPSELARHEGTRRPSTAR